MPNPPTPRTETNPVPGDLIGEAVHAGARSGSEQVGDVAAVDDRGVDHVVIAIAGRDAHRRRIAPDAGRHGAFGDELGVVAGGYPLALRHTARRGVVAHLSAV